MLQPEASLDGSPDTLAGSALSHDAAGQPVLIGGSCRACGARTFPKTPVCHSCMAEDIAAEEMPRTGSLYAFTTVHAGPKRWTKPFTIGYVDLPNGVRVFTHLRGATLALGATVALDVARVGTGPDGEPLHAFVFVAGDAR